MMAYMRLKSKKVVSEEVSLASNKKYILKMGKVVGKHGAHYFTIGQKDSMWEE
jgi:hypothetical protein